MALFQSFMPEGVNQKSQAFVLLIDKGSFLKTSMVMPVSARFTWHLGLLGISWRSGKSERLEGELALCDPG